MLCPIYYITAKNVVLKRFTGIRDNDLFVLDTLYDQAKPVHYVRLYDLIRTEIVTINYATFTDILKRNIDRGYISRSAVAGNVLYCITLDGKRLLHQIAKEMDCVVYDRIRRSGNGFNPE